MPVQKRGNGWRARRQMGSKTFNGPARATEAAAMQDAQELELAAAVSMDRLKEVHARLQRGARRVLPAPSVVQHGSGWRVRVTIDKKRVSGPTRRSKTQAETDCRRLTEAGPQQSGVAEHSGALAPGVCRGWRRHGPGGC